MIRSITVTNHLGDSIELELERPEKTGLIVKSITGLGPGAATINTTEISANDGGIFNSARVPTRNIVISLGFMFKETIEDVRQLTYKYFPLKGKVNLRIKTDNRTSEIDGYVESNEPNIFSNEEGSDISIICPDPFFYSTTEEGITTFSRIEPMFEFPFSNESLTEPLITFSEILDRIERNIVYSGDCAIGITIRIRARGPASNITIYNVGTREIMRIDTSVIEAITGSGLINRDEIVISTVTGQKSAVLVRNGKTTNILNSINKDADWFKISKGSNIFACTAETGRDDLEFEIQNRVVYEGV